MSAVGDFMTAYLHYTVNQRLFEDTCRQLRDYKGEYEGRKQLVGETLRLASTVSDLADAVENSLTKAASYIQKHGSADPDLPDALPLISNIVKEDRARASAYALFVTSKRYGGSVAAARKPMVANPFVFDESDDSELYSEWTDDESPEPWEDTPEGGESDDEEPAEPKDDSNGESDGSDDEADDSDGDDPEGDAEDPEDPDDADDGSDNESDEDEFGIPPAEEMDPDQYEGYDDLGYSEDGEPQ